MRCRNVPIEPFQRGLATKIEIRGDPRRTITKAAALAAATFFMTATAATGAVNFDATTGTGFVGKGDVQLIYGWNNAQLQANAADVSFTYEANETYTAVCTFTTGDGTRGERTHNVNHNPSTVVNDKVIRELRKNKLGDVTGFNRIGYGALSESGEVPVVDGPCMGNQGHDGTWSSVTLTGSTDGGLFVHYGDVSRPCRTHPSSDLSLATR